MVLGIHGINELLRKAGMTEKTEDFKDDAVQGVKVVGGKQHEEKGVTIVGGNRPGPVKTLDKRPEDSQ